MSWVLYVVADVVFVGAPSAMVDTMDKGGNYTHGVCNMACREAEGLVMSAGVVEHALQPDDEVVCIGLSHTDTFALNAACFMGELGETWACALVEGPVLVEAAA